MEDAGDREERERERERERVGNLWGLARNILVMDWFGKSALGIKDIWLRTHCHLVSGLVHNLLGSCQMVPMVLNEAIGGLSGELTTLRQFPLHIQSRNYIMRNQYISEFSLLWHKVTLKNTSLLGLNEAQKCNKGIYIMEVPKTPDSGLEAHFTSS
jgi:hypothetical protein